MRVAKSKLPQGGFKRITDFTGKELAGLRRGVTNKQLPYSNSRVQQVHVPPTRPADYQLTEGTRRGLKSSKDFRAAQVGNMASRYQRGAFKRGTDGPSTTSEFRRGRREGKYGFAKSYVNGKFVRALDLTAKQRNKIKVGAVASRMGSRRAGQVKGQFGLSRGASGNRRDGLLSNFRDTHEQARELSANMSAGNSEALTDLAAQQNWGAFTLRTGSKSGGKSQIFHNPNAKKMFLGQKKGQQHVNHAGPHELAHANPRRSEYRMAQVQADPARQGREEGRADFLAAGHYKSKPYKANKYGERVTGYAVRAHTSNDKVVRAGWKISTNPKKFKRAMNEAGLPTTKKGAREATKINRVAVRGEQAWTGGYKDVHDRMLAAGTRHAGVTKSMDATRRMVRNREGQFMGAQTVGFGMVQHDIPIDNEDVAKADKRPYRDESKGELPYRRSDAKEGLGYSAAGAGLTGAMSGLNARAGRKNARTAKELFKAPGAAKAGNRFARAAVGNKKAAIAYGAGAGLFGAAGVAFGRDLKRGGTGKHRFTPEVKKGMPDMADVHVQGVLRPVKRVGKVSKAIGPKQVMRPAGHFKVGRLDEAQKVHYGLGSDKTASALKQNFGRKPNALYTPSRTTRIADLSNGQITDVRTRGSLTRTGKITAGGAGAGVAGGAGGYAFSRRKKG